MTSTELSLPPGYFHHTINARFQSQKLFFTMYMPLQMGAYTTLKESIQKQGLEIDWKTGMIEEAKMMGFGWIGLKHAYGDKLVHDDFIAYEIIGDYKQMKDAYKKIMTDFPKACSFYNLYLTDPSITKQEENKTYILFKL